MNCLKDVLMRLPAHGESKQDEKSVNTAKNNKDINGGSNRGGKGNCGKGGGNNEPTTKQEKPKCEYCKDIGHKEDDCWRKFPEKMSEDCKPPKSNSNPNTNLKPEEAKKTKVYAVQDKSNACTTTKWENE